MGSKTYDGVWFTSYSRDHAPPHVHGKSNGVEVVIDLLPDGTVIQSRRRRSVKPANAATNEVRRILTVAAANAIQLKGLWRKTHG